jgi:hypothetical protein
MHVSHGTVFVVFGAANRAITLENYGLLEEDPVLGFIVGSILCAVPVNSVDELAHSLISLLRLTGDVNLLFG